MKGKNMNDFELMKVIYVTLTEMERESRNNIFILRKNTIQKIKLLDNFLKGTNFKASFDRVTNAIEISIFGYVFDSCSCNLKSVFNIVDLFVIDALDNGQVCIEMKILNASEIIER
ncbi:MAG: hypothetical protein ACI4QE_00215 [Acutalibacteraceae bacterium]